MYIEENSASDDEESDNPRDILFMALIQYENTSEGKYSTKGSPASISKVVKQ